MQSGAAKGLAVAVIALIVALWGYRVYTLNEEYHCSEVVYGPGEELDYDVFHITNLGGGVVTAAEFAQLYGRYSNDLEDGYVVYLKIRLRYDGEGGIALFDLSELFTQNGFRSATWSNGLSPYAFSDINFTETFIEDMNRDKESELFLVANINRDTMERETYQNCKKAEYYYVLDTYPVNIRLRVDPIEVK